MPKLTKAQRERCLKLATYLDTLPEGYKHFDMTAFIRADSTAEEKHYAAHNGGVDSCATVACAVGHGPAAGVYVPKRFITRTYVNWVNYSELFVGRRLDYDTNEHFDGFYRFEWCFSEDWKWVDNHHYGAAARLRYMLEHDVPEDFDHEEITKRLRKLYRPYDKRHGYVPAGA